MVYFFKQPCNSFVCILRAKTSFFIGIKGEDRFLLRGVVLFLLSYGRYSSRILSYIMKADVSLYKKLPTFLCVVEGEHNELFFKEGSNEEHDSIMWVTCIFCW